MKLLSAREIRKRNKERVAKWRNELTEKGYKGINVMVSPDVFEIIQKGKAHRRDSNADAIERICHEWLHFRVQSEYKKTHIVHHPDAELKQPQIDRLFEEDKKLLNEIEKNKSTDSQEIVDELFEKHSDIVPDRSDTEAYKDYVTKIIVLLKAKNMTYKQVAKEMEKLNLKTIRDGKTVWTEGIVRHLFKRGLGLPE